MDIVSKPIGQTAVRARSWKRMLAWTIVLVLVLAAASYVTVSVVAADRLSHPDRIPVTGTPADFGLSYENVSFKSSVDSIPLKGWYIDSPGSKVILILHGRNGVRNDSDNKALKITRSLVEHNYDVFTFDFRAHGESGGERYAMGQWEVRDVAGAIEYLKGRGVDHVGVIGYSMGAGTELNASADLPEMAVLVSDSAFSDVYQLFQEKFEYVSGLPNLFVPGVAMAGRLLYGVDLVNNQPQRQVARLGDRPLFLIHGTDDELINIRHAYALQKAAMNNPNSKLWVVEGACHTCAYDVNSTLYMEKVIGFYDQYLK